MRRVCPLGAALVLVLAAAPAPAHQPHDVVKAISVSPSFASDGIGFVVGSTAPATLPKVLLRTRDGGNTFEPMTNGIDARGAFVAVQVSPSFATDRRAVALTDEDGVYLTQDGGDSWRRITPPSSVTYGDLGCSVSSSGQLVVLALGQRGGMIRTDDLGKTWTVVAGGSQRLTAVAFSPDFAADRSVLAGDDRGQLYVSGDEGRTWLLAPRLADGGKVNSLALAPGFREGGVGFAATERGGLYRTTDGGLTFQGVNACLPLEPVTGVAVSPDYAADQTVFAITRSQGVFRSTDGGGCFTKYDEGISHQDDANEEVFNTLAVGASFATDGRLFLGMYDGIFRSEDRGETWFQLETIPQQHTGGVRLSPTFQTDHTIAVARYGSGAAVTADGGESWAPGNTGIENPFLYDLAVSPEFAADRTLFAVHAYRVLRSTDAGASWELSADSAAGDFPNVIEVSPTYGTDGTIFSGSRADGLFRSTDRGLTWSGVYVDAGGRVRWDSIAISPAFATDRTLFASREEHGIVRSTDGGETFEAIAGVPADASRGARLAISPQFPTDGAVFAATLQGLYRSTDRGETWQRLQIGGTRADIPVETVAISPAFAADRTLLASVRGNGLFRSRNGGASWQRIADAEIASHRLFQKILFSSAFASDATILAATPTDLYRSTDGGETWTWLSQGPIRHEDNKPVAQWNLYEGSWATVASPLASAGAYHLGAGVGSVARFFFVGTEARWIGNRAPDLGIVEVWVDGVSRGEIDLYAPALEPQVELFASEPLPNGFHEVQLVPTGEKNLFSTGYGLTVDAFDVLKRPIGEPSPAGDGAAAGVRTAG